MKKERTPEPDTSGEVPSYIVTFSDMVTLLLTFFVMLLSLADVQDPELFNKGRDSFVQSLQHCGLGVMFDGKIAPGFNQTKERYKTTADEKATRSVDARRERRRRAFERLNETMTSLSSQIVAERVDYTVLEAGFAASGVRLSLVGRDAVWQFARNLRPPEPGRLRTLYVLGLADKADSDQTQWTVSAQRAQEVADFLRQALPADQWHIYSWGAGPGHDWGGRDGAAGTDTQIMIGVLQSK